MKRTTPWLITAALLAGAWLIALVAPGDDASVAPFIVPAVIGEEAVGREFTLTVQDVQLAEHVSGSKGWSADGTWLVVDLDAEANHEQYGMLLAGATLRIADQSFRASERMDSMLRSALVPGVSKSGTLAFELPESALSNTGILQLSTNDDTRADSVVELEIHLDELTPVAEADILATDWTNP